MKKYILASIFALSLVVASSAYAQSNNSTPNQPTIDTACVKAAVEKRENALAAAWDKFTTGAKSALETRKAALLAAWDITDKDQRAKAIKDAWKAFKDTRDSLKKDLRQDRLAAWRTFQTDRRACHAPNTGESSQSDNAL